MRPTQSRALRSTRYPAMHATPRLALRRSSPPAMPQDMPPQAGYDPVQYKRNLPARGLPARYYILGVALIMSYGFYKYGVGIREYNELGREKMWARIHLMPLLTAEDDRDQVRRYYANLEREKDLLGGEHKVYHSDRFIRPTFAVAPPPEKE